MKLNLSLLLLVVANVASTVSAKNEKSSNSYLICSSNDLECQKNQINLCNYDYNNCLNDMTTKNNCNKIRKLCKELSKTYGDKKCATSEYSFEPTTDNVRILGRANYYEEEGGYLWFGLTGSGVEYSFTGKTTTINVTADTTAYSEDMPAHIIIYADGETYLDTVITEKITDFTVKFDKPGKHVVRFIKVSEAERGSIRINEIKADSKKIKPTHSEKLKMEFIGDSITCAYGVDDTGFGNFSTRTQDGTKSYAYKTALKFHADISVVAYSGFAILSCYSFDGGRTPDSTVPAIYDRLGFSFAPNEFDDGTYELQNATWDQQQYIPDLVVINLGTNDSAYFQSIDPAKVPSETEAFVEAYEDFLHQIRALYPKAKILCTLGMMGQEVFPQIEEAVENYIKETGDKTVKTLKFNVQDEENNGLGVDGHPSAQSHVDAAYELIEAIEKLYGWKSDPNVNIEL